MISHKTIFEEFLKRVDIDDESLKKLLEGEKLFGFGNENLVACPWISKWLEEPKSSNETSGIFMMQDWWKKERREETGAEALKRAVDYFDKPPSDQTLRNFLDPSRRWKDAIQKRKWLVTNAVWALRRHNSKATGYLGDVIHKNAFLVWVKVVLHFADHDTFDLVIAGEWGVFGKNKMPGDLKSYLQNWCEWAELKANLKSELLAKIEKAKGRVHFCPHPFTWNFISCGLIDGPLIKNS